MSVSHLKLTGAPKMPELLNEDMRSRALRANVMLMRSERVKKEALLKDVLRCASVLGPNIDQEKRLKETNWGYTLDIVTHNYIALQVVFADFASGADGVQVWNIHGTVAAI